MSPSDSHAPVHPALQLIEQRVSANFFDPQHTLSDDALRALIGWATRAPSAYNLQNWRFVAVRSPEQKARLRQLAYDQAKVSEAAVTFIVCGQLPRAADVGPRFASVVTAGLLPQAVVDGLQAGAQALYADPQTARDEAVRSATLGAATLMLAAEAQGLASGPMIGFDFAGVADAFGLAADEVPVMLIAVGRAAPGNWPQKARRDIADVLALV